ncbi:MAG: hypothetical protein Q4Q17_03315, partial [Tissierellia bacterium]|nr:hypothetical protein [Tissierellia bacterium]
MKKYILSMALVLLLLFSLGCSKPKVPTDTSQEETQSEDTDSKKETDKKEPKKQKEEKEDSKKKDN